MSKTNIGILGGGLSGLTAAYQIYEELGNEVNITIIEKNDRLGGRILTKNFKNCPMEIGAMFYVEGGTVDRFLKKLNIEKSILLDENNFISIYRKNKIMLKENFLQSEISSEEKEEINKIKKYVKNLDFEEKYKNLNFEKWYIENIGELLIPFWNRMLMSLGVRNLKSINAYFGLTLVYVFMTGNNYLHKNGLKKLIDRLSDEIVSNDGKIIKNADINLIEKAGQGFKVTFLKEKNEKEMKFDKIISALKAEDLVKICNFDLINYVEKIKGHPLSVYAIESDEKIWTNTWGLVVMQEQNPIQILLDWGNVESTDKTTPILIIADGNASKDKILKEFKNTFPNKSKKLKITYEKHWGTGLHQPNENFYDFREQIIKKLPKDFYMAGDWMTLPALEGAVISGMKSAKLLINEL